jgi:mannose-6-phosphate isomerase-like protein (cupin superfamily)
MKSRSFLRSAASAFPLALTDPFALAAAATGSSSQEFHVVLSGEDRFGETRSRGFSRILFKNSTQETGGNLFIIEHSNLVSGGPPLHLHLEQEEWFFVMEGEVLFQLGEKRLRLRAGDSVLGPRKVPHAFTAVGDKPGRMLIAFSPAGKMEQFFRDTAIPNAPREDATFFRRYDMELLGPPLKASSRQG